MRAAVEMGKDWRTDRILRRLEALLAVADNLVERFQKILPLGGRQTGKEPHVRGSGGGLRLAQCLVALRADLDGIGAAVVFGPAALNHAAAKKARHDVRQCRTINSCSRDQVTLREALVLCDHSQNRKLARRQATGTRLSCEDIRGALTSPVQQVRC